jgi:hypothetical protein
MRAIWGLLGTFWNRLGLRRLIGHFFGKVDTEPNPYYAKLREIQERGHVTPEDLDQVVVPLLVMRGGEIASLRRELRHAISRSTILYFFVVVLLVFGGLLVGEVREVSKVHQTTLERLDSQDQAQVESRAIGRATSCAIQSAVIRASVAAILGGVEQPPELDRNLQRLGFPPEAERRRQAQQAARAYALEISRAVEAAVRRAAPPPQGGPATRPESVGTIVNEDGTLDCRRLDVLVSRPGPGAKTRP